MISRMNKLHSAPSTVGGAYYGGWCKELHPMGLGGALDSYCLTTKYVFYHYVKVVSLQLFVFNLRATRALE